MEELRVNRGGVGRVDEGVCGVEGGGGEGAEERHALFGDVVRGDGTEFGGGELEADDERLLH